VGITSDARQPTAERTGIGLRLPHIAEVVATRPHVGWLEIHTENFLANPHGLEFLHALVNATGCRLLCDVSNVHLSGHNMGYDAYRFIDEFPAEAVAELHLGGFTPEEDEATPGGTVLVDTHAHAVADPVWDLYAHALRRFGPQPTIVEWDNDLPALRVLTEEAAKADRIRGAAREDRRVYAR
jgi:uncharacterized protein